MDDFDRTLRNRNRILASQADTIAARDAARGRARPGATLIGKVYNGGKYSTAAGRYVLVHPGRANTALQEGPANSYQWDMNQSIPVAILSDEAPAVDDILYCSAVASRWVAEGKGRPPLPCGCGPINPNFSDPWYITDDAGSHTLTYTPAKSAWIGTSTVQCLAMIKTEYTGPPDYGISPDFQLHPVTVTYSLFGCYSVGLPARWLLRMSFNGGSFRVNGCPWAIQDGDGGGFVYTEQQSLQLFSCNSTMLSFNFPQWLNGASNQYSCFASPGYYPVGPTPGGYGLRVASR